MNGSAVIKWLGYLCVCASIVVSAETAAAVPMVYALSDTPRHIEVYAGNNGALEHWGSFNADFANQNEDDYYAIAAGHFIDGGHVDVAVLNISTPCGLPPNPCALCGPEFDSSGMPFVRMPEVKIFRVEHATGGGVTATELAANNLSTTDSLGSDKGRFTYYKLFAGDFDGDGLDELGVANPLFGNALAAGPNTPGVGPPAGRVEIMDFNDQPKSAQPLCFSDAPVSFSVLIDGFQMPARAQFVGADVDGDGKDEIVSLVQTTGLDIDAFNVGYTCGGQPCPGDGSPQVPINYPLGDGVLNICKITDYGISGGRTYRQGTCQPHAFSGQPITAGTGGVFPMALAAGPIGRGQVDGVFVGYNRADNEASDLGKIQAFAMDLKTKAFGPLGTSHFGGPIGGLTALDLDGNGTVELASTRSPATGEQISVLHLATAAEDTIDAPEVAGGFRGNENLAHTMPIIEPAGRLAGGVEKPLLRLLFFPLCFAGDDVAFRAAVKAQVDFFVGALDMGSCPSSIQVDVVPPSQINFACSERLDRTTSIDTGEVVDPGIRQLFIDEPALAAYDIHKYTTLVATTDNITYRNGPDEAGENVTNDLIFIRIYPPGFQSQSGRLFDPSVVLAHEFGHLTGLAEEYCDVTLSPNRQVSAACNSDHVINRFEERLQCPPPPSGACCDAKGFCEGNINRDLDGPCIMGSPTARRNPGDPPPHMAYCENCFRHLKQLPPTSGQPLSPLPAALDCGVAYPGDGPILSLGGTVTLPGLLRQIVADFVPSGRAPAGGPHFAGDYRITVTKVSTVATIYQSFFDRVPRDLLEPPFDIPPVAFAPYQVRIPLPAGVGSQDQLAVTIERNGAFASKQTINGQAPTAVAGADQTVECNAPGGGTFTLDGLASSDPDGDTVSYLWTAPTVTFEDRMSPTPQGVAPLGTTDITLVVADGVFDSAADTVTIHVQDTAPPAISAAPEITVVACDHPLTTITIPLPQVTEVCSPGSVVLTGKITVSNGSPVTPNVPLTNGATSPSNLPPGVHTIRWEATDGVNTSHFDQTVRIESCWPEYGRDASRSRRSAFTGPTTNQRAFTFAGSLLDIRSSPAVAADGTVYVGSDDHRVYAINVDGSQKWKSANTGIDVKTSPAIGFGGSIFVANDAGNLLKLDPTSGTILCQANLHGLLTQSSPVVGSDGTVYIGSNDHKLYAINPGTCAVKWTFGTGADVDSSPAVGRNASGTADVIYFGSDDHKLYAVSAAGALQWNLTTGGAIESSPALSADGTAVYAASEDHHVYAINAQTGTQIWSSDLHHDLETAPAVGPTGTVYVGDQLGNMAALNPTTGAIVWQKNIGPSISSSPAVDAGNVVFVGSDERVLALNGASGAVVWSFTTGGDIHSSPAIGVHGTVYVGSDDHKLYAFGAPQVLGARWSTGDSSGDSGPSGCTCRAACPDHRRTSPWQLLVASVVLGASRRRRRAKREVTR